ncbi:MAG: hypothetical protein GPOALKHO_001490 [Sodalis sp.]|nr:MAG: hypothetical protein GPOALKHO_001490 [Sodalis sp.]
MGFYAVMVNFRSRLRFEGGKPVMGVVYVPVTNWLYAAADGKPGVLTSTASVSHRGERSAPVAGGAEPFVR